MHPFVTHFFASGQCIRAALASQSPSNVVQTDGMCDGENGDTHGHVPDRHDVYRSGPGRGVVCTAVSLNSCLESQTAHASEYLPPAGLYCAVPAHRYRFLLPIQPPVRTSQVESIVGIHKTRVRTTRRRLWVSTHVRRITTSIAMCTMTLAPLVSDGPHTHMRPIRFPLPLPNRSS